MFKNLLGIFSKDMGVDLGTSNVLVYVKDKGLVVNEPSVVAINARTDQVMAVGEEARKMIGKTPPHIVASKPLVDGVISDFEVTEKMMEYFIRKVHQKTSNIFVRPRVIVGIPLDITEVEKKAVEDAALQAGAREVFLVENVMAAAIGNRLPVQEAAGNMVVDIGGGTTEIAVISLGGIVTWKSIKVAGNRLNNNIIDYARDNFSILLGERMAEEIKMKIGSAYPLKQPLETKMRGRDMLTGLPKESVINDSQVRDALQRSVRIMVENIKNTIESTPPELVADIYQRGIVLSGGGALLRGLDELIKTEIKIPVHISDDPLTAVVRGMGIILEDLDNLKDILVPPDKG